VTPGEALTLTSLDAFLSNRGHVRSWHQAAYPGCRCHGKFWEYSGRLADPSEATRLDPNRTSLLPPSLAETPRGCRYPAQGHSCGRVSGHNVVCPWRLALATSEDG